MGEVGLAPTLTRGKLGLPLPLAHGKKMQECRVMQEGDGIWFARQADRSRHHHALCQTLHHVRLVTHICV